MSNDMEEFRNTAGSEDNPAENVARKIEKPKSEAILDFDGKTLHIRHDVLKNILQHSEIGDKPIAIISISGAFRKGKSFILNFFLRYLRNHGYKDKGWMGDLNAPLLDGFHWRGGKEADTKGINIWNKPFIVNKDGREIAVLLMDTQGLFDRSTEKVNNTLIFSISTLLSSVQIINVTSQIQENDLEFLKFFTEYAKKACSSDSTGSKEMVFQSLMFLVRDWQHIEDNAYGLQGGKEYLTDILDVSQFKKDSTLYSVRQQLHQSFERIQCFLMPHPGMSVIGARKNYQFKGVLNDIAEDFVKQLEPLVSSVLHPRQLVIKEIGGKEATQRLLLNFAAACDTVFKSGKLPDVKNILEATADAVNLEAHQKCLDRYNKAMEENIVNRVMTEEELQTIHKHFIERVLNEFDRNTGFGSEINRLERRNHLQCSINESLIKFLSANKHLESKEKLQVRLRKKKALETYKEQMYNALKNSIPPDELLSRHSNLQQRVLEDFFKEKGKYEMFENEYCEKLKNEINAAYENFRETCCKQHAIKQRMEQQERSLIAIREFSKRYEDEISKACKENYIPAEMLTKIHENIRERILAKFTKEIADSSGKVDQVHVDNFLRELQLKYNNFASNNNVKELKANGDMEKLVESIHQQAKESIQKKLDKQGCIAEQSMKNMIEDTMMSAITEFRKKAANSVLASEYENQLSGKMQKTSEKLRQKNSKYYEAKLEEEANHQLAATSTELHNTYKKYMEKMCGSGYVDEVQLLTENNRKVDEILISFDKKNNNLKKDITTARINLEQEMAATYRLLSQKNETHKLREQNYLSEVDTEMQDLYKKRMEAQLASQEFVEPEKLADIHESIQMQVLGEHRTKVSNSPFAKEYIGKLIQKIPVLFEKFEETNNSRIEAHKKGKKAEGQVYQAMKTALSFYQDAMEKEIKKDILSEDEIKNHDRKHQKAAVGKYDKLIITLDYPSPELCEKYKEMLLKKIKSELEEQICGNDVKRKIGESKMEQKVRELMFTFEDCIDQKKEEKHHYSEKEFAEICSDLIKDSLSNFDKNCTHAVLGQKFKQDLKARLKNSAKNHKQANTEKLEKAQKEENERILRNAMLDIIYSYRSNMTLSCGSIQLEELTRKHHLAERKALNEYNRKAEEIGAKNDIIQKYLPQLKHDIENEYTSAKDINADKARQEENEAKALVAEMENKFQTEFSTRVKNFEFMPEADLERLYNDLSAKIMAEFNRDSCERHRANLEKKLEGKLNDIYVDFQRTNFDRRQRHLEMEKAKREKEISGYINKFFDTYKENITQVAEVPVNENTLKSEHVKEKNNQLSALKKTLKPNEIQEYTAELSEKIEKEYESAKKKNRDSKVILDNEVEEAVDKAIKIYESRLDQVAEKSPVKEIFDKASEALLKVVEARARNTSLTVGEAEKQKYREKIQNLIEEKASISHAKYWEICERKTNAITKIFKKLGHASTKLWRSLKKTVGLGSTQNDVLQSLDIRV